MLSQCAFGALVARWGILWRHLGHKIGTATAIIAACVKLHNFCIDVCKLNAHRRGRRRHQDDRRDVAGDEDGSGIAFPLMRSYMPRSFTHAEHGGDPGHLERAPRFMTAHRHQSVRRDSLATELYNVQGARRPQHARRGLPPQ